MQISEYELILAARLFVLKRAIGALIVTHPAPEEFARVFDAATGLAQIEHAIAPGATQKVRDEAARLARELLDLAEDVISRKPPQTGDEN